MLYKRMNLLNTSQTLIKMKRQKKEITTSQESLNYKRMYKSGVCQLDDKHYSKMIQFTDISYQLAKDEEKQRLFGLYCGLLNSFDSKVSFQFCFINFKVEKDKGNELLLANDEFDPLRAEYFDFLAEQREKGNNGIIRNKYLLFTIKENSYKTALRRLENIETNVSSLFRSLGVQIKNQTGIGRLSILNYIYNSNSKYFLDFEEKQELKHLMDNQFDYLAPTKIDYRSSTTNVKLPNKVANTLHFNITATELSDRVLSDFLSEETEMIVSLHVRPLEQKKAIKMVKGKESDLKSTKINEQKKSLQRGYDMDILPGDLNENIKSAEKIKSDLQKDNEKYFYVTFTTTAFSTNEDSLDNTVFSLKSIAERHNCELVEMKFQQEKAFLSAIPLGFNINEKELERGLTTSATAVFVPFTTQELYQETNLPTYYGLNQLSNNMIQVSRKNLKNPNGLFLGTPGSGKSFSAKREMIDVFLKTKDDIIISDPEGEYFRFVELLKGEVVKLSLNSSEYINPLDITMEYGEGENPVSFKADFVLTLMSIVVGVKTGLTAKQKTATDKATRIIYRKFIETQDASDLPILENLYDEYRKSEIPEVQDLADALELYVHGSLNIFNNHTNINPKNRLICFNIQELGTNLKDLGMLVLQDYVWNRVTENRKERKKSTWYYMDEFHKLLAEEQTSNYSVEFWKRFRKWGGIPTGLTQNIKDLLASPKIETIFENSDFIYLLNQATGDRKILQEKLDISDYQANFITNSNEGEGLIIYNGTILPFKDKFPKNNQLYPVMTTKPDEIKKYFTPKVG